MVILSFICQYFINFACLLCYEWIFLWSYKKVDGASDLISWRYRRAPLLPDNSDNYAAFKVFHAHDCISSLHPSERLYKNEGHPNPFHTLSNCMINNVLHGFLHFRFSGICFGHSRQEQLKKRVIRCTKLIINVERWKKIISRIWLRNNSKVAQFVSNV